MKLKNDNFDEKTNPHYLIEEVVDEAAEEEEYSPLVDVREWYEMWMKKQLHWDWYQLTLRSN